VGSVLFAAAMAAPFFVDAGSFVVAVALVLGIRTGPRKPRPTGDPQTRLWTEIGEGVRWLWRHRLLRTLALMLGTWNLVTTASAAVFVLFATEDLHVSTAGYGLLFSAGAVGSVAGSVFATRIIRGIGAGRALLTAVVVSGLSYFVVALTSNAYLVGAMGAIGGLVGVVWNVITVSLRQAIIPDELLGRVNSVYRFLGWG
jgi:Na+/melibiose symporter-like transporter